ncbi:MAG: cytochrome c4 [Xanthomonadales bacterium]|nr:cytochrome c4 [Xanthomonadales bacterium]
MKALIGALAGLCLFLAPTVHAQGDAAAGEQKSATCAACHGADGNSAVAMWPKIAGQHEAYLNRHITLIRDGQRPVPEMMGIVANLTDEDIADLSAYFAGQTISPGAADEALVARGERLYRAGDAKEGIPACMACHGPAGEGNPLAGYPWVAGQHATYTASMLNKYRAGDNWGEDDAASAVMVGVARRLTDEDINAVSSYLQGLYRAQ